MIRKQENGPLSAVHQFLTFRTHAPSNAIQNSVKRNPSRSVMTQHLCLSFETVVGFPGYASPGCPSKNCGHGGSQGKFFLLTLDANGIPNSNLIFLSSVGTAKEITLCSLMPFPKLDSFDDNPSYLVTGYCSNSS